MFLHTCISSHFVCRCPSVVNRPDRARVHCSCLARCTQCSYYSPRPRSPDDRSMFPAVHSRRDWSSRSGRNSPEWSSYFPSSRTGTDTRHGQCTDRGRSTSWGSHRTAESNWTMSTPGRTDTRRSRHRRRGTNSWVGCDTSRSHCRQTGDNSAMNNTMNTAKTTRLNYLSTYIKLACISQV